MSPSVADADQARATRALLACAAVFGPLFYASSIAHGALRDGFDITRHPLSLLSLGDLGWVQVATFVVVGALAILGSVGLRRQMRGGTGGRWGPILLGATGLGMIVAGIFPPDPSLGFPPGAPEGVPTTMSPSSTLHGLGFFVAFGSLTAMCFILARRAFREGRRASGVASLLVGLVTPVFIAMGMMVPSLTSEVFAVAGIPPFAIITFEALRLRNRMTGRSAQGRTPREAPL